MNAGRVGTATIEDRLAVGAPRASALRRELLNMAGGAGATGPARRADEQPPAEQLPLQTPDLLCGFLIGVRWQEQQSGNG